VTTPLRPELVITGRIATLAGESGLGWVEAIAVGGGRVLAAGRTQDVLSLARGHTKIWRLPPDQAVMPGITDAHLHLMALVLAEWDVDLSGAADLPASLALVAAEHAARADRGEPHDWLTGHGWSLDRFGRWPDADMLEAAAPRRPVALWAHDHHTRWLNRTALAAAGIDEQTADPDGGLIRRDDAGRPTGILHEHAARMPDALIRLPDAEQVERALAAVASRMAALGITGCHDPGLLDVRPTLELGPDFYRALARRARLPLRVHSSIRAFQLDAAIAAGLRSGDGWGRWRMGWLKLFADGSLGSRSAALLAPYEDAAEIPPTGGQAGMLLDPPAALATDLRRAAAAGISGQVHAIGDAAVRLALDLLSEQPPTPLMRRVEHAQLVDPADLPRFGQLGIAASVQPVHLRSDAPVARAAWGERAERSAFPLAALDAAGALIPFGTDAPVEPADPWPGIAAAICRRDPADADAAPLGPGHALDLTRAIRAACLDPALVARQPDVGRLTAGCRADLLVIPAEVFADPVDPSRLAQARPLATLIDGEAAPVL
jgi:predicted amidohydrolase YtcJ